MQRKISAVTKIPWLEEELEAGRPPERVTVSEWATKYRVLSKHSAMKGPYKPEMVPFLIPIMDMCLNPMVESLVLCKSAQIGGTDAFFNVLGYYVHQDPCPMMLVLADQETAEHMSIERVQSMFKSSETLKRLIDQERFTKNEMSFINGAYIALGWASSVSRMASRPIKVVIFDEIDKPGYNRTTDEADPISLGEERANTFPDRKFIKVSTPTSENGNIIKELESCDIIYDWHVPCPQCGQFQPLRWSREHSYGFKDGKYLSANMTAQEVGEVVWEGGKTATNEQILKTARYKCGECAKIWTTQEKNDAVRKGKMLPRTKPKGYETKIGFHLNRLYSLFDGGRLEKLVRNWMGAQNDLKKLQGFINASLGEPWKQLIRKTSEAEIVKAKCDLNPQTIPQQAVALTCGIDCQKYSFWFVVRAWAQDFTSWLVHYGQLSSWQDVECLLFETAYPVIGTERSMKIWRACVDTGGGESEYGMSMTEESYGWLRKNAVGRGCRVWGTKGSSNPLAGKIHVGKPLDKTPSGKPIPGGLQIVLLDTVKLKDLYHYRLNQAIEQLPQAAYLHKKTDHIYINHITAEEKQKDKRGLEIWFQKRRDNHLLDAETLSMVCADPEWLGGGINLLRKPNESARDRIKTQRPNHHTNWIPERPNWFSR